MAPTPSSVKGNQIQVRTPQSRHRLNFTSTKTTTTQASANPNSTTRETPPQDHPVEVIGRIRNFPNTKEKPVSVLQTNPDKKIVRVRADVGYRDFSLDGVSLSEEEDLESFYKNFVESRIKAVKLGEKCTIMMYGPTGSGKSHTMFGCAKQPGIVYRSLRDILGEESDNEDKVGFGTFVQVTVLEIYNEEIYDLLSCTGGAGGGFGIGWPKGSASKVRLEVMGKKAKNATFISGTEAGKISKEVQKVEKRRIVKSTQCNERSSRSHCMIILDVPTVGGRLMLVDMAGSENIDQAGQTGFEAKMQTGKINQGNIALKRVVESIANGDSHVPFRDSKLTMLLQDSFEDDKSKILMILCASPDPKEIHKTICTLEYGAKAKCIIRGPHTPIKDKNGAEDSSSAVILGSRIAAMDQFIYKLQMENKLREKERNEAHQQLLKKEEEVAALRAKLETVEGRGSIVSEHEINSKVNERTQTLKLQLEKKLEECQRMAEEFVDMERRRMEERILQQQQEVEMLRRRLEEIEFEICHSREVRGSRDFDGSNFAKRLLGVYADEDPGMVKSMDLDMGDAEPFVRDVKHAAGAVHQLDSNGIQGVLNYPHPKTFSEVVDHDVFGSKYGDKVCLSTVFEDEEVEEEEELKENVEDEEVEKVIIEEKRVCTSRLVDESIPSINSAAGSLASSPQQLEMTPENAKDTSSSRKLRIQNIFTLCGNHRELYQHSRTPMPAKMGDENFDPFASPIKTVGEISLRNKDLSVQKSVPMAESEMAVASKENYNQYSQSTDGQQVEVYVKWEASKENPGKFITTLKVVKDATLADLRKLIDIYLGVEKQPFTFLVLGDPTGAPVPKENEATTVVSKLPFCNQSNGHLACLQSIRGSQCATQFPASPLPLSPIENKLPLTPSSCFSKQGDCLSPNPHLSSTPFITLRRH
ncbi:hypothetical protein ACOSQ3_006884 [Xanthoceras sorbifolium]